MDIRGLNIFTIGRNTGHKGGNYKPGLTKGHILVPYGWSMAVDPTDSDTTIATNLLAALNSGFVNDTYNSRWQMLGRYINTEDKSKAPTMQSFNHGIDTKINDGRYAQEFQYDNGGMDYHMAVRSFQGKQDSYKAIAIEDGGIVKCVRKVDANGLLTAIQGVELERIDVNPVKEGTFQNEAEFKLMLTFADPLEMNENSFVIGTGQNLFKVIEAVKVTDLYATAFTATSARVHPFMLKTIAGDVNVANTLGSILNDATLIASATNDTSGVAIAVTSVAVNVNTGKYVVTFTAGAGYVAGQTATVRFGAVSALHALGADYYAFEQTVNITMA